MNKKIIIGAVITALLGIGGYFFVNAQNTSSQHGKNVNVNGNPVVQSHRSYEIEVTSNTNDIKPNQQVQLSYLIKNDKGETVKNFQISHEKLMHFLAVRKDLSYFQHLHPDFNKSTGEFTVPITFPEDGPYRIYPDFVPGDENQMKLPVTVFYDVEVGNASNYADQKVVADSETVKNYGDYSIATTFKPEPKQQEEVTYTFDISKNGEKVTNLEKYLGALGHSVIIKEGTLDFIHTHALESTEGASGEHTGHGMQNEKASTGPKINFATTFPEPGNYKIFTQFQHEGEVQTINNVVNVK